MKITQRLSRRRGSSTGPGISLFPFLAVLICTMGALVPLLLAITRTARLQAEAAALAKASEQNGELTTQREDVRWRIDLLKKSRARMEAQLTDARLELGHIEDHSRRLREQLLQHRRTIEDVQNAKSADQQRLHQAQVELDQARTQFAAAQQSLADAHKSTSERNRCYAVVPYEGPNQTHRRPIYLECLADAIVLQPEGIELTEEDFEGPLGPGNPLAATLRAAREYMLANRQFDPQAGDPYPMLLVRPEGITAYYAARAAMKSWGFDFGYELVDEDWKLAYPPPDPRLAEVVRQVVASARVSQARLAAAAPRHYGGGGTRTTYRAAPGGGFVRETAPSKGGDGGYTSAAASGPIGAAGGSGYGATGGSGYGATGGSGYGATGASGSGYGASGGTGSGVASGYGASSGVGAASAATEYGVAGGSAAGGTAAGGGVSGYSANRASGTDAGANMGGDGPMLSDANGGSADAGGGFDGTGGGVAAGGATGSGGLGYARATSPAEGAMGATSGLPSGAANTGGRATGGSGHTSPGGAPSSNATTATERPDGYVVGQPARESAASDRSAVKPSDSGARGRVLLPGEWQPAPERPVARHEDKDNDPRKDRHGKSLAQQRGVDWGLRDATRGSTGVTRPIRVQCFADHMVVLSERGVAANKSIPLGPRTETSIDLLISTVWEHIETWGMAGRGMYWRPLLQVYVDPNAEHRYADLVKLLDGSGVLIERK